jgi:hypothetical protein
MLIFEHGYLVELFEKRSVCHFFYEGLLPFVALGYLTLRV